MMTGSDYEDPLLPMEGVLMDEQFELDKQERVSVTMSVDEWANIIAAVGMSPLELAIKERLNSMIYDCVTRADRALS